MEQALHKYLFNEVIAFYLVSLTVFWQHSIFFQHYPIEIACKS